MAHIMSHLDRIVVDRVLIIQRYQKYQKQILIAKNNDIKDFLVIRKQIVKYGIIVI